jgi:hypothetical protein
MRAPVLLSLGVAGLAALGCRDLDRFSTESGAYCGSMVSAPNFQEGFTPDNLPPSLRLRLTLDARALSSAPGTLTTDDAERGLCAVQGQPLFRESPLRPIPELEHDPLSLLEFGEGRDHNFFAWSDSTCQGTMLALVSLMRNEDVEVRLFKPARLPPPDAGAADKPGFALFYLQKNKDGCGF